MYKPTAKEKCEAFLILATAQSARWTGQAASVIVSMPGWSKEEKLTSLNGLLNGVRKGLDQAITDVMKLPR